MAYGTRVTFEPLREAAVGALGAAYTAIGTPTADGGRVLSVFNTTNQDLYISFDGVTDRLRFAPGSGQVFDLTTNEVEQDGLFLPIGTTFYARLAPASQGVWIEVLTADGGV